MSDSSEVDWCEICDSVIFGSGSMYPCYGKQCMNRVCDRCLNAEGICRECRNDTSPLGHKCHRCEEYCDEFDMYGCQDCDKCFCEDCKCPDDEDDICGECIKKRLKLVNTQK